MTSASSRLEKVVVRIRQFARKPFDDANSDSGFEAVHERVIAKLNEHFEFPSIYLEYLAKYSMCPHVSSACQLFTAQELLRQNKSWLPSFAQPETILVIGTYGLCGDPLYLRLDLMDEVDAPVFSLMHDSWDEDDETNEVAKSFLAFLT